MDGEAGGFSCASPLKPILSQAFPTQAHLAKAGTLCPRTAGSRQRNSRTLRDRPAAKAGSHRKEAGGECFTEAGSQKGVVISCHKPGGRYSTLLKQLVRRRQRQVFGKGFLPRKPMPPRRCYNTQENALKRLVVPLHGIFTKHAKRVKAEEGARTRDSLLEDPMCKNLCNRAANWLYKRPERFQNLRTHARRSTFNTLYGIMSGRV